MFEYFDLEEENQSEKEESNEEHVDDELNNDQLMNILNMDITNGAFRIEYSESLYHIYKGTISPPPEQSNS